MPEVSGVRGERPNGNPLTYTVAMVSKSSTWRRVWIVDDSTLDAERARRTLEGIYGVERFADGDLALERLATASHLPDVLILDWLMPGVSGIDVCRFVRSDRALDSVAVLLLTVHQRTEQIVEGLEAGANDFLSKPYAEAELRARVRALIRSRELLERAERAERTVGELLANSPDAILSLDDAGLITYANTQAESIMGQPRAVTEGKHVEDVVPELASWWRRGHRSDDHDDLTIGHRVFSPSVRSADGTHGNVQIVSLRDVTLERQLHARRLDVYSVIAHDLRSPLSAALLRVDALARRSGGLEPGVRESLHKVQGNLRELLAMVNDFLEVARAEGGVFRGRDEEIGLTDLARGVVDEFRPLADVSRVAIDCDFPGTELYVSGHPRRLRQALGNLVANGLKFTPAGGCVVVGVSAPTEMEALVEVRDTGRGIAPEVVPTIFERYARSLDAEHEVAGTGLGLMIVRETIHAHGGKVGVDSREGEGSRFWFCMPLVNGARGECSSA